MGASDWECDDLLLSADERYELLRLLALYVEERGTASLHVVDVADDLASFVTAERFASPMVAKAQSFAEGVRRFLP